MSDENKYYAKMDDEDFLKQIDSGKQSFTKGDMLKIRRERTQIRKADGTIKNEYRVIKVLEVQKRAKEIDLPFEEGE